MCGRLAVTVPQDAMAQLFSAMPANNLPHVPNYNVCPTDQVHVVVSGPELRRLGAMRWGFVPQWYGALNDGPLLINARAETIAQKPAFRGACRERRCILPVSGFYEWSKDAQGSRLPWYITRTDAQPMALAGIWQSWGQDDPIQTCAVVTTTANGDMEPIHHRMPVILDSSDWGKWLGEEGHGAATLMRPAVHGTLRAFRVDPEVNSNRAKGSHLIAPL